MACSRHFSRRGNNAVVADIINQVLPILLLLGVGIWARRVGFISAATIADLRKLIVNLALPSVLFLAFLDVELERRDSVIVISTFVICVALLVLGRSLRTRFGGGHVYFPMLMTGFEAGMLGISLFGTAYGLSNIGAFAVVDLGHELFIWFVFLAVLLAMRDESRRPGRLARAFVTSPVIVAIIAGLAGNLAGIGEELGRWALTGGFIHALDFLAGLTVPLILLVVGYGIHLEPSHMREAVAPLAVRFGVALALALVLPPVLIGKLLDGDALSQAALFTLLILPPPFIIPLYMREDDHDERRYVNNVLSLYTLLSVTTFIIYVTINPL
jgi:predicted permease